MDRRRFRVTSLGSAIGVPIASIKRSRTRLIRVLLGLSLGGAIVFGAIDLATAQSQAEIAKLLRVEWEPGTDKWGPPRLVGHIYNNSTYRIGSVRLRVETLDASDRVIGETLAWVYVSVPARNRAYFSVRRPSGGAAFRLAVESFVLIARESIEETP
jgi:hypothetical protein